MKKNKEIKILCVFTNLLGGSVVSAKYKEALDSLPNMQVDYLYFDNKDYLKYKTPKFFKLSSTLESTWIIKEKYKKEIPKKDFDLIIFQGFELFLGLYSLVKNTPTIISLDTTPALAQSLIRQETETKFAKYKSHIASFIMNITFKNAFKHVSYFLAMSEWCKESLTKDYHINDQKISVNYPFVNLNQFCPKKTIIKDGKLKLLFVGNAFKRKGGEFLLKLFQNYLSDNFILQIVSNDKNITSAQGIPGVEIIQGISHENISKLIQIYQESNIFLFPTRREQLGLVLMEAMSTGLTIIASNSGGVKDLVQNDKTGYLMPYYSTEEEWANKILYLSKNLDVLNSFSSNSRLFAEKNFNKLNFDHLVVKAVNTSIK